MRAIILLLIAMAKLSSSLAPAVKYKVAVIGGGPSGSCAAEALSKNPNIECIMFERKANNAKPCGGAIPLCMVDEFDLPATVIDRKVRKMKMISPTNREVDIGDTLKPHEYIGMTRREILDGFLRDRAISLGTKCINGLVTDIKVPSTAAGKYTINYNNPAQKAKETMDVDYVIGGDGAHSRVAKAIDAGEYNYAIAFQERIKLPADKMNYYEDLAEMYVGDDVSPDFYGWVFPKYDHVGVGTGTVINRPAIQQYQKALRERCAPKIDGGKIIKVEAHPIPEHMRARRVVGRAALVGDAAGYVTKCSGEGIYFAAKSGRMAGEAVSKVVSAAGRLPTQGEMIAEYIKPYDKLYVPTYTVLDVLQKLFYNSNAAREAFVDLCGLEYVQRTTFDSYLYKKIQASSPIENLKLAAATVGALVRGLFISKPDAVFSNPVESLKRL